MHRRSAHPSPPRLAPPVAARVAGRPRRPWLPWAGLALTLAACGGPTGDRAASDPSGDETATATAPGAPVDGAVPAGGEAFRPLAVGDPAPAYAAPAIHPATLARRGDTLRVGPGAQPGVTLVNVWATWCTSCREEFALLDSLERAYGPRGLRVVAVSVDRAAPERVARFAESQRTTFAIGHDPEGRVQEVFRVVGVPESYLVGRDGTVRWRHAGALEGAATRAAVEGALR